MAKSQAPRKKKAQKKGKVTKFKEQFLGEIKQLQNDCANQIARAANCKEIIKAAKASDEIDLDEVAVAKAANRLATDLNVLLASKAKIDDEVEPTLDTLSSKADEMEIMQVTTSIATKYGDWQDQFLALALPSVEEITNLCTVKKKESK